MDVTREDDDIGDIIRLWKTIEMIDRLREGD